MKYVFFSIFLIVACSPNKREVTNERTKTVDQSGPDPTEKASIIFDFDTSHWVEILSNEHIQLDIRYATANNFTKQIIYDCPRCFLNKVAAEKFRNAIADLVSLGYGVKLFDCYRPHPAQQRLWDIVPNPMYVADPAEGSMHNRGLAIDMTLTDSQGRAHDMGTSYDFFGKEAYHDFVDLDSSILARRKLLKSTMARHGFGHIRTEWWHYSDTTQFTEIAQFEWPCPN